MIVTEMHRADGTRTTDENEAVHRATHDDLNQHVYTEEWRCHACKEWIGQEDVIWARDDGTLSTADGRPYCTAHVP